MATKDKKLSVGRKQQTASPISTSASSSKEVSSVDKIKSETGSDLSKSISTKTAQPKSNNPKLAKKLVTRKTRKLTKKPRVTIKVKAKRKSPIKIKQKLGKSLLINAKAIESKKLLRNGVKQIRLRQKKITEEPDDGPPVLEPIFPYNIDKKQQRRKLIKKPVLVANDTKKIQFDNNDLTINTDSGNSIKQPKKTKSTKNSNAEDTISETIEDVINDLSELIDKEEIKKECDSLSESSKSDSQKPKKLTKKQKIALLQKEIIRKENIENSVGKFDASQQKVIDMLDLNVQNIKQNFPSQKRRHSIEKFPIGNSEGTGYSQFNLFSNLPRSISPRLKRGSKIRRSTDGINRRVSPYPTRSESPARILRNGKHRRLKDLCLLEGLDTDRKRRRLCSDYSGSELSMSKLSGNESDSSYSDLVSLHGADLQDSKEVEIKKEKIENFSKSNENFLDSDASITIKRSLSSDTPPEKPTICDQSLIDTNSNLCRDFKPLNDSSNKTEVKIVKTDFDIENIAVNPSVKVPEKSLILDIMKQTFNEKVEDVEKKSASIIDPSELPDTGRMNTGVSLSEIVDLMPLEQEEKESDERKMSEIISKIVETIGNEEFIPTITTEEDNIIKQNGHVNILGINMEEEPILDQKEIQPQLKLMPDMPIPNIVSSASDVHQVPAIVLTSEVCSNEEIIDTPIIPLETCILQVSENSELEEPVALETDSNLQDVPNEEKPLIINETDSNEYKKAIEETPEEIAAKESILKALGLQSLKAAEEAKLKVKEKAPPKTDTYTGTLKTVIKINRDKKKARIPLKMTLQKSKLKSGDNDMLGNNEDYKIMKEGGSASWKHSSQSSDTAGAHRKTHYSNRSNTDGSSEHTSDGELPVQEGPVKALVIPEKASSFSIHPGRLCKDECSYCYGKFGLFDTPCHIAQMKSVDRQDKILATEKHLARDSCLCDACYRHIDRKANTPSYTNKSYKRGTLVAPGPRENHCHVLGCNKVSNNILRRKWIIKMRKSICQVINIDLDNPGLHSIPICDEHYVALEHLMVCAMCKRRLARNHIHYIGSEIDDLNTALHNEDVPLTLTDKPVVCKLCKCFATVILKRPEDRLENCSNFYVEYKKRLLHFNNIVPMDEAAAEEPIIVPTKEKYDRDQLKKKRKLSKNETEEFSLESPTEEDKPDQNRVPSTDVNNHSRSESPSDYLVDYNTLIPSIAMDCGSDAEVSKEKSKKLHKIPRLEPVKDAIEITKKMKKDSLNSDIAVQRLGSNPSISVRQLFPGEEDLSLQGHIDFSNVKEKTPEGWEKCNLLLQYDKETKQLWQELQKPYGNQSSFMRHLILLEKYFRNGDLELSANATHHSINYSESVHNRLRAYDNIPSNAGPVQPLSMIQFNTVPTIKPQKSNSGIITSATVTKDSVHTPIPTPSVPIVSKLTPVTLTPIHNPHNFPISNTIKPKLPGAPPGLISLLPGTNRPAAPLVKKVAHSQKIKFPITKNWRPNLIPIDPNSAPERKTGLVQVISGGKPFHITLEDYKKMCAIKRSFEMKQKKLQEAQQARAAAISYGASNSLLKSIPPRKGLIISKSATVTSKVEHKMETESSENILEKLDQQVENLESKLNENKTCLPMPKIPKSLTVIPQTVSRVTSRPTSPGLLITPKLKLNPNKS